MNLLKTVPFSQLLHSHYMRNIFLLLILATALVSCVDENTHSNTLAPTENLVQKPDTPAVELDTIQIEEEPLWTFTDPYADLSDEALLKLYNGKIKPNAQQLRNSKMSVDSAFYKALLQIWPAWYGTDWDYDGYTHKPRNGIVACGYFVSTTLRDVGMKLNRYDLAKLYSHAICTNICGDDVLDIYDLDSVINYIQSQPNDIYIVGLDSHVGFLLKENNEVFFVHSNYMGPVAVTKEIAIESPALNSSNRYVLGSILTNKDVLSKWSNGEEIIIAKE
jgi:hypothetical protein